MDEEAPWLLVVSPPCTMFSALQNLNILKMDSEEARRRLKEAMEHVAFGVLMCLKQAKAGRMFLFEHPATASFWQTALLNKLYFVKGGQRVNFDFCMMGMRSADEKGEAPAKKRTSVFTNSDEIAELLKKYQCDGQHRHVQLMGGKAKACEVYPDEFCEKVCEAAMREKERMTKGMPAKTKTREVARLGIMELVRRLDIEEVSNVKDITDMIGSINEGPHEADIYEAFDFVDDVTGKPLNHDLAKAARKTEIEFFRKMKVYEKVPRSRAKEDGCKVITTRWLDINKGDDERPNYRARLVGREIKMDNRLDLFAATPPLESLRLICAICASRQSGHRPHRLMSVDVKRAYFYAKSRRPMYVEIPIEDFEDGDEHRIGKLNLSLYGTRDAAQNWAAEYKEFLVSIGFAQGKASPCNFKNEEYDMALTVHGDDFTISGPTESLEWLLKTMKARYEVTHEILGPEANMVKEMRVLNRVIRWTDQGLTYEADQRHAELIVEAMGMKNAKGVATPAVHEPADVKEQRERSPQLSSIDATMYRALAARLNYLALDRTDLQFTAKSIARYMASPRMYDWGALKRVARYLVTAPRVVQLFEWQEVPTHVTTHTDSDWAGDKITRKSTSGGTMKWGSHLIKSWSSTQQVIATSSGEAELYAMVKGVSQTKGLISMLNDLGYNANAKVCTDANAAIGIVHRQGLGKTRHVDVQYLWVQQEVYEGRLNVEKVGTQENMADLLTKALEADAINRHMANLKMQTCLTRARTAPKLATINTSDGDKWVDKGDEEWKRKHSTPRRALFTPMKVAGGAHECRAHWQSQDHRGRV